MSKLPLAAQAGLRDPADEATLSRIWQGIDARLTRARAGAAVDRAGGRAGWRLGALAAVGRGPAPRRGPAAAGRSGAALAAGRGARRGRGGVALRRLVHRAGGGAPARAARVVGLHASSPSSRAAAPLRRSGRAGPRRWQIECGLATVEVVGTHFDVERSPGRLRVAVARGQVLVRGERVPDRVRRLAAGEALEVTDARPPGARAGRAAGGARADEASAADPADATPELRPGARGDTAERVAGAGAARAAS